MAVSFEAPLRRNRVSAYNCVPKRSLGTRRFEIYLFDLNTEMKEFFRRKTSPRHDLHAVHDRPSPFRRGEIRHLPDGVRSLRPSACVPVPIYRERRRCQAGVSKQSFDVQLRSQAVRNGGLGTRRGGHHSFDQRLGSDEVLPAPHAAMLVWLSLCNPRAGRGQALCPLW